MPACRVAAMVDLRTAVPNTDLTQAVRRAGVEIIAGHAIKEAIAGPGKAGITGAIAAPVAGDGKLAEGRTHTQLRPDPDGGGLFAGGAPAAPRRRQVRLRHRQPHVSARHGAGACVRGRLGQPGLRARSGAGRRPPRRLAGGARRGTHERHGAAGAGRPGLRWRHASLADLPARQGQGLRRFRRGPQIQGPDQRHRRRLRQCRAAEALFDRRHGPEPGQAFRRRGGAHRGARDRREPEPHERRRPSARPTRRRSSATWPAACSSRSAAPPCITATWSWARR